MVIVAFLFWSSYRQIARIFKWITLVLLAYVATALSAGVDWRQTLLATLRPRMIWSEDYLAMLVGILGTTISPYLLASLPGGSKRKESRSTLGATDEELRRLKVDVFTGYFIILTTAATLHAHGLVKIETAKQAAEALRPLAGNAAYLLFTLGLIGTGMLGVPVLAGSCADAILGSRRLVRLAREATPRREEILRGACGRDDDRCRNRLHTP